MDGMSPVIPKLLIIFFAFLGVLMCATLRHKKKNEEVITCPLDGNCDTVIYSPYGKFFGIDLTILGAVYYVFAAVFYGFLIAFPFFATPVVSFVGFLISMLAVGFSVYLIIVQAFVLRSWCTWCLFSAGTTAIIFGLAFRNVYHDIPTILAQYKIIIVILHAFGAALGVGAVTLTDILFFKFLKDGKISHEEANILDTVSDVIWFALVVVIITGIGLYIPRAEMLMESTKFLAKVFVVGVVLANGVLLNLLVAPKLVKISFGMEHVTFEGEMHILRRIGFALGAVSLISWYTTFILGSVRSIPLSSLQIIGIYLGILFVAVLGSQIFEHRLAIHHRNKTRAE